MNMGRKEIDISEIEMSGGTLIYVCIHITNNYSTHDHATDTSTHDESTDVFSWKGKASRSTGSATWMPLYGRRMMVRATHSTELILEMGVI